VWCDAWVSGGWNAVDATPQEQSDGLYQLGPAPVAAVHADAGGPYDVDFVFAEVNADLVSFFDDGRGHFVEFDRDVAIIGTQILTKAVGSTPVPVDITDLYKPAPREAPQDVLSSGLCVSVTEVPIATLGDDIVWSVVLSNTSTVEQEVQLTWSTRTVDYRGRALQELGIDRVEITLVGPGETKTLRYVIPEFVYCTQIAHSRMLQVALFGRVSADGEAFANVGTTQLVAPLELWSSPRRPLVDQPMQVSVKYANPLGVPLTNIRLTLRADGGDGGLTFGGQTEVHVALGTLAPGASLTHAVDALGLEAGRHIVGAVLESTEVAALSEDMAVTVEATNGPRQR
jgi:hypothetical protein